jgi:hypothetical protein
VLVVCTCLTYSERENEQMLLEQLIFTNQDEDMIECLYSSRAIVTDIEQDEMNTNSVRL